MRAISSTQRQHAGTAGTAPRVVVDMRFTKMQGVGNDFVLVNEDEADARTDWQETARRLCARHSGVGADGLLVAGQAARDADVSMRMFNPDGSEDMCGNGLRCVALWAHRAGWAPRPCFVVQTLSGARHVEVLSTDSDDGTVRVGMGVPLFAPADVPFAGTATLPGGSDAVLRYPLTVDGKTYLLNSVNTGSTHTVIFGDAPSEAEFVHVSPLLETHALFPERTSVLWATPAGEGVFAVRIWERGAGETWGCGTGACAVGVLARTLGLAAGTVEVQSRGGALRIEWTRPEQEIRMTGPAAFVFEGAIG